MKTHELKTWPVFYKDIINGTKTFEVRNNDRNFQVGDTLLLREYDPDAEDYTGAKTERKVSYILGNNPFFQLNGMVILGIQPVKAESTDEYMGELLNLYCKRLEYAGSNPERIYDLLHSFVKEIKQAEATESVKDELLDKIEIWHKSDSSLPLYEYLGMTRDEYAIWISGKKSVKDEWISVKDNPPAIGIEIIGFNEKWIDEDFNPNGTRQCVVDDMGWMIARWNASDDYWVTDYTADDDCRSEPPTHWIPIKQNPLIKR